MIDGIAARERVDSMHKSALAALERAEAVERYIFQIYALDEVQTAFNPEVSTLLVTFKDGRTNAKRNLVEVVKRGAGEAPSSVVNGARTRLFFGEFSVLVAPKVER